MENYPQYGTNFWGSSSENNYGFGSSHVAENIDKRRQEEAVRQSVYSANSLPSTAATDNVQSSQSFWKRSLRDVPTVGDCTVSGLFNEAKDIYGKVSTPLPWNTGIPVFDFAFKQGALKRVPYLGSIVSGVETAWNAGNGIAAAQQAYDNLCRKKQ